MYSTAERGAVIFANHLYKLPKKIIVKIPIKVKK